MIRGLRRTPVGSYGGKFAHNQRLDVRPRGFLVLGIRADISDVGIRQADNLSRVAWIGENFLIAGEAGIKNDFAAAPRNRSRCAPIKNTPVFERKYSLPCLSFRQWILFPADFFLKLKKSPRPQGVLFHGFRKHRDRAEVIHGPIGEHGLAVDESSRHWSEDP